MFHFVALFLQATAMTFPSICSPKPSLRVMHCYITFKAQKFSFDKIRSNSFLNLSRQILITQALPFKILDRELV
jgi:hypothetical protein